MKWKHLGKEQIPHSVIVSKVLTFHHFIDTKMSLKSNKYPRMAYLGIRLQLK